MGSRTPFHSSMSYGGLGSIIPDLDLSGLDSSSSNPTPVKRKRSQKKGKRKLVKKFQLREDESEESARAEPEGSTERGSGDSVEVIGERMVHPTQPAPEEDMAHWETRAEGGQAAVELEKEERVEAAETTNRGGPASSPEPAPRQAKGKQKKSSRAKGKAKRKKGETEEAKKKKEEDEEKRRKKRENDAARVKAEAAKRKRTEEEERAAAEGLKKRKISEESGGCPPTSRGKRPALPTEAVNQPPGAPLYMPYVAASHPSFLSEWEKEAFFKLLPTGMDPKYPFDLL